MSNKNDIKVSKEYTVTLKSGKKVSAEVEFVCSKESNYGADADGNRGVTMYFVEDYYLTVPITDSRWSQDDDGNDLSESEVLEAEELLMSKADDDDLELVDYL